MHRNLSKRQQRIRLIQEDRHRMKGSIMLNMTSKRINYLNVLLEQTRKLYEELLATVKAKIEAMRRADLHDMREQTRKEHTLAKRLHEREGFRCQLMENIGRELDMPIHQARNMSMSELAKQLDERDADRLIKTSKSLRETVSRVAHVNRVAGVTTREIILHLNWVLDSVKPQNDCHVGYAGNGKAITTSETKIFETVG